MASNGIGYSASQSSKTQLQERVEPPHIWQVPDVLSDSDLQQELQRCLTSLEALTSELQSVLSRRTTSELGSLTPNASISEFGPVLYYAARDLWRAYWLSGEQSHLKLTRAISLFLYSSSTHRGAQEQDRSNALHIWMNTQLPLLIRTCDLHDILEDAKRLCMFLKCSPVDLKLKQGIVEAHAGEYHRMVAAGDQEGYETLLRENGNALRQIHEEYYRKSTQLSGGPSEDEIKAWEYLFPATSKIEQIKTLPKTTILTDPGFLDVIRGGSHEGLYEFINNHLEDIQQTLERRLDARISPEHLMFPEGNIYQLNPATRGELEPRFIEAKDLVERGDYFRASGIFDRLASRLQGRSREICRNFQAYALARHGDLVPARRCLIDLPQARFPYPSAYWNLACCIPADQMDQRLEVLALGLECAPQQRILRGAVYLALLLNDGRLRQWLPYLTLTEALLLSYHAEYDSMDYQNREYAIFRLNDYAKKGEPNVPDPTAPITYAEASNFLNMLLELYQEKAIEFWLRCREPVARKRFDYWQLKVEFLDRTKRRSEAAKTFREELVCRLSYLGKGRNVHPDIAQKTRQRAEQWLNQCMTPDLREVGHDIYNILVQFEQTYGKNVLPRTRRIQDYYGHVPPPRPPSQAQAQPTILASQPPDLAALIARVGAECHTRLHEVSDLVSVRRQLNDLIDGLKMNGKQGCAETMTRLLHEWDSYSRLKGKSERESALENAQRIYAEFQGCLQHELNQSESSIATQLLGAFQRVNDRLARVLNLLPQLVVEAPDMAPIGIDPDVEKTSFALRVRSAPGGAPVRLKRALAMLDDEETELPLRDKLDQISVFVSPDTSSLLTFETVPKLSLGQIRTVRVELTYEYASAEFTQHATVQISPRPCSPLPARSPYISGRPLEVDEIQEHFFGREKEQQDILESVMNGQQKLRYVEGIRRVGKTSLLNSIQYEIAKRALPLIPVYVSAPSVVTHDHVGRILYNLLGTIAKNDQLAAAEIAVPTEDRCCVNLPSAYSQFLEDLAAKIPAHRVLVLLDNFQELVETAHAARENNPSLTTGIKGLLNMIQEHANPSARLLWIFAGQRAFRQYRTLLPGALLWGVARGLPVDFVDQKAVGQILSGPLAGTSMVVPPETIARVHFHTAGHPEAVQQVAEFMLLRARDEKRYILTPSDADEAAYDLAKYSDTFADTWYPVGELSRPQKDLMAAFVNAVPVAGRVEPHRLVPGNQLTEALKQEIDDLAARKILDFSSGTIGVKAYVLELWLRKALPEMITDFGHGSIAIFIDVANLTSGTGAAVLSDLDTAIGEAGIPGKFTLTTVIDQIEKYACSLSPAPVAARWVVNYPKRSPAVVECNAKGYQVENIPQELFEKGSDDIVLREKLQDVERGYPTVNHFVLVTGDKDYRLSVDRLLANGKFVHVVGRSRSLTRPDSQISYDYLARQYPNRFTVVRLEQLLEGGEEVIDG